EAVDVLLQAEGLALEGARHVEGAVAVLPAAVAEGNHHVALRHEFAVEPGDALIAELLCHDVLYWFRRRLDRRSAAGKAGCACVSKAGVSIPPVSPARYCR